MEKRDTVSESFFTILRAGLWEKSVRIAPFEPIDFDAIYDLAEEQSVIGLVAAGLEHVEDRKIVKKEALPFLKKVYGLEARNSSMNSFIGNIIRRMRNAGVYALLVKGQGVAQCYSRPQWRSSGDIDLLLDEPNYEKAKALLVPLSDYAEQEDRTKLHLGLSIDPWFVELHGTLHSSISHRVNRVLDDIQKDTIVKGGVRVWRNNDVDVFLPNPDNDLVFIFSHILQHLYRGGIGLRQICDWVRLLYTYRESLDKPLLRSRLQRMGVLSEWKAFGCFAVDYLGLPCEFMPLYDHSVRWKTKHILSFVLEKGNFGKSVDNSYRERNPILKRKLITFSRQVKDSSRLFVLFPANAFRTFFNNTWYRLSSLVR
jgi:hypothetical protein